jgi:hypothetical protein
MARLLVHVEGQTEESFVNEVLADYLGQCGYESVSARLVGNARLRERRGGIRAWPGVKKDVINHLNQDHGCIATTMVDYYGLPQTGDKAWPGRAAAGALPFAQKANHVEQALAANIASDIGNFMATRFVPFVMMHEFEGLLFSDCGAFGRGIGREDLGPAFQKIRDGFSSPEEINDSPITAPSKRVEALVSGYEKPLHGTLAILEIGLAAVSGECPHFRDWLDRLCLAAQ